MKLNLNGTVFTRGMVALLGLLLVSAAVGGTVYVDQDAGGGGQTGASWTDAYTNLTAAVSNIVDGTEVWVAEGIYQEGAQVSITNANVTVYGGFAGTETLLSQRDVTNHVVTVDGLDAHRCFSISGTNVTLDGLRIEDGYVANANGGALLVSGSGFTLKSCTVTSSRAAATVDSSTCRLGGGMYVSQPCQILDCVFSSNQAANGGNNRYGDGGGVCINGSGLSVISNTVFRGNNAYRGSGYPNNSWGAFGGAAAIGGGGPFKFVNCIFDGNSSTSRGGAISAGYRYSANFGSLTVLNCVFYNNSTASSYGATDDKGGGAIYAKAYPVYVTNSIFLNNEATSYADTIRAFGDLEVSYTRLPTDDTSESLEITGSPETFSNVVMTDPLFADAAGQDFHLKSEAGRWAPWDPSGWTNDNETSFCILLGNPGGDYSLEPSPNGSKVNMGAYGGTEQASKHPVPQLPEVTNRAYTVVNTTVKMRGEMLTGSAYLTLYYGPDDGVKTPGNWYTNVPLGDLYTPGTTASVVVVELNTNTTYHYRWFASNEVGAVWASNTTSFLTGDVPPQGPAGVVHVDKNATGGFSTGLDWPNAFITLVEAADTLVDGSEVWVAEGTYQESKPVGANAIVTIGMPNVSVYGGFTNGMLTRAERDPFANVVTVDGANAYRCFNVSATNVTLDGLTIWRGRLYGSGGGIYVGSGGGGFTLRDCQVLACRANGGQSSSGGGMFAAAAVSVLDCFFGTNDTANAGNVQCMGGGLSLVGATGSSIVSNTVFRSNKTYAPSGWGYNNTGNKGAGMGGALFVSDGTLEIVHCIFDQNWSQRSGGAIGVSKWNGTSTASVSVDHCTFYGNTAANATDTTPPTMGGGLLYQYGGTVTMKNSISDDDLSSQGTLGRAIKVDSGTLNLSYSRFDGTNSTYMAGLAMIDNVITEDPLFADAAGDDFHLKSFGGRWTPGGWVTDAEMSPCIDTGDPTSAYANEPEPNGWLVNMGVYGNSAQASRTGRERGVLIELR